MPVWGRLLPQEPGALAPTSARPGPSRLVFDWSASVARPRVAGSFQPVLASVIMSMRADRRAASRDGLDEEEGWSRRQAAVAGISEVVLDSTFLAAVAGISEVVLDSTFSGRLMLLGKLWPAALLAQTHTISLSFNSLSLQAGRQDACIVCADPWDTGVWSLSRLRPSALGRAGPY